MTEQTLVKQIHNTNNLVNLYQKQLKELWYNYILHNYIWLEIDHIKIFKDRDEAFDLYNDPRYQYTITCL